MRNKFPLLVVLTLVCAQWSNAQLQWLNRDSVYSTLPAGVHIFETSTSLDGKPNHAFYLSADLDNKNLEFVTDTAWGRGLTPANFFTRNGQPLVVVNTGFFSLTTHHNLNLVVRNGELLSYNQHDLAGKGKDTFTYRHVFPGALGISRSRRARVMWTLTDSSRKKPYAAPIPVTPWKDSIAHYHYRQIRKLFRSRQPSGQFPFRKWKVNLAVGGGPVLFSKSFPQIANNEEIRFSGKAIDDRHPRTAMGYTADGKLIILVIEGRNPGVAEGATLLHEAELLRSLGCVEAINLDGGGSSCLLVNGKETIKVSDKTGQRPVPSVLIIRNKK